jgi:hypothetical protein
MILTPTEWVGGEAPPMTTKPGPVSWYRPLRRRRGRR